MSLAVKQLFTAQAADGSSPWYTVQGGEAQFGHNVVFGVLGSLGGGTCKVEIALDPPSVASPTNIATLLTPLLIGVVQVQTVLPPGARVRFTLSGSTGPSLNAFVME